MKQHFHMKPTCKKHPGPPPFALIESYEQGATSELGLGTQVTRVFLWETVKVPKMGFFAVFRLRRAKKIIRKLKFGIFINFSSFGVYPENFSP